MANKDGDNGNINRKDVLLFSIAVMLHDQMGIREQLEPWNKMNCKEYLFIFLKCPSPSVLGTRKVKTKRNELIVCLFIFHHLRCLLAHPHSRPSQPAEHLC